MTTDPLPLSGDLKNKVKQLLRYAGWYEERLVDISIAQHYYSKYGVEMMPSTQRFYQKFFGLHCEWFFSLHNLQRAPDFDFGLFPFLINGIKDHIEDAYFRDMASVELKEIEQFATECCQPIGIIGHSYPAQVWISKTGKLYAQYEYQDEIECFDDIFALVERELQGCELKAVVMKSVKALDGKLKQLN